MISYRSLALITALCLAFIGLALAIKVSQSLPRVSPLPPAAPSTLSGSRQTIAPEASFYETAPIAAPSSPSIGVTTNSASGNPLDDLPSPQAITAEAYLVGNVRTGQMYLERQGTLVLPVASMSKLVTAIAATDTLSPTTTITITPAETDVPPDGSHLAAGESFMMSELLYPLLLDSSNVAAEALASSSDRTKFLYLMNSYAWEVGMPHTFFADPTGLSPHNAATAEDFFALARYLYKFRPDILALTRTVSISTATTTDHGAHIFASIHPFVTDPRFIGGKTGHTDQAGDTMLTILDIGGQPVAFIVLASETDHRAEDTDLLIDALQNILK